MTTHAIARHEIFQTSLIPTFAQGVYEDEVTLAGLPSHGSFGIGALNGFDGEMIILGGICYRLRGDGSVSMPELTEHTPYAVVTNSTPSLSHSLTGLMTREELSRAIDTFVSSSSYAYALRVTGQFTQVSARTVTKQDRPYWPMIETTDGEEITRHEDFSRMIVGLHTSLCELGTSTAGCRAHIVSDDHTWGKHLVDLILEEGEVELCLGTDFHIRLPLTEELRTTDLSEDMIKGICQVEHHWNVTSLFPEARGRTMARSM